MTTQQFEDLPDEERLTTMVDLLRYENASLKERIRTLEKRQEVSAEKLEEAEKTLEVMQAVLDMQNAEYFAGTHKASDQT